MSNEIQYLNYFNENPSGVDRKKASAVVLSLLRTIEQLRRENDDLKLISEHVHAENLRLTATLEAILNAPSMTRPSDLRRIAYLALNPEPSKV